VGAVALGAVSREQRVDDDRAKKIEEAQGFTEHAVEQLSAEIAELNRRLTQALTRLARVEARLERLASGDGDATEEQGTPAEPA
jgi:uncharacterized coiled-coil protein SlyX